MADGTTVVVEAPETMSVGGVMYTREPSGWSVTVDGVRMTLSTPSGVDQARPWLATQSLADDRHSASVFVGEYGATPLAAVQALVSARESAAELLTRMATPIPLKRDAMLFALADHLVRNDVAPAASRPFINDEGDLCVATIERGRCCQYRIVLGVDDVPDAMPMKATRCAECGETPGHGKDCGACEHHEEE